MKKMQTPIHFEIPVDNMERAQKFYRELFEWDISSAGNNFDNYFIIQTTEDGRTGINGGMLMRSNPDQPIINYISVDDIDASLAKLEELGGSVLMPKMPVKGVGWNCVVRDTENNMFGMIQKNKIFK